MSTSGSKRYTGSFVGIFGWKVGLGKENQPHNLIKPRVQDFEAG